MRKTIVISLAVHVAVTILVFQWVSFREVKYVPRQVYNVTLVSAAVAQVTAAPASEAAAAKPAEEKKKDEMVVPPEKPKAPKKVDKSEEKTIPTTRIQKADTLSGSASDSSAGQAPAAVTGGVSFDSGDFPFSHYVNRMRQKIAASWQVPGGSEGSDRSAVVYFRVHRDGSVSHVQVEKTSSLFLFDQSCERAVLQAAPMPPLPREYADDYLGVHFSFVYLPTQ